MSQVVCHSGLDPESSTFLDSRFRGNDVHCCELRRHAEKGGMKMRALREVFHGLLSLVSVIGAALRGVVTIMAFTEGGRMRQFCLSRRIVALSCIVLMGLTVGSTVTLLNLVRGQYYLTRMKYLERENLAMTSLLQG